jgi:hypothetical protein
MMISCPVSRREFLGGTITVATAWSAAMEPLDFPIVDLHVHLDNSSIEQVLPLAHQRHVRFGIVEHAGTKENQYPVVLSTDEELSTYLKRLEGKGVYRGVQAEWTDWMSCFSPEVLARLDYVLTDAMTFPGPSGRRVKLWEPAAQGLVDMSNHERFMDRFVDWHVDQLQLRAPQAGFSEARPVCRGQVQLRLQWPVPQYGQARLQPGHGENPRPAGLRHLHAWRPGAEGRAAEEVREPAMSPRAKRGVGGECLGASDSFPNRAKHLLQLRHEPLGDRSRLC